MADPDLALREGGGFDLLSLLAFLPSVTSSFFLPKIRRPQAPGPLPYIRHCFITICEGGVLKRDKTNAKGIRKQAVGK